VKIGEKTVARRLDRIMEIGGPGNGLEDVVMGKALDSLPPS